jgi:hypothetical protein
MAVIKQNNKYGLINTKGEIVVKPEWDYILGENEGIFPVEADGDWGYINKKGEIIIIPQYRDADFFYEGLALVGNEQEKYGFINKKGDTLIDLIYDESFGSFSNGLADVTINDSSGYIDKNGKVIIPLVYSTCYPFMSSYAEVESFDGESLLVDKKGNSYEYEEISEKTQLWRARNPYPGSFTTLTGQGRLNKRGDTIIPPIFKATGNFSDHMYIVQDKNNKWGAYNDKGRLVVIPQFDNMWHYHNGVANFSINGKWGFVNKKGEIVIDPEFDYASPFNNGFAYVELNGKAGFINRKGEIVIPIIYETYRMTRFE